MNNNDNLSSEHRINGGCWPRNGGQARQAMIKTNGLHDSTNVNAYLQFFSNEIVFPPILQAFLYYKELMQALNTTVNEQVNRS